MNAALLSHDGTSLATASVDGTVRFWDLRPKRPEPAVYRQPNEVWDAMFSPDGSWFVMGGDPGAEIRDARTGALRHALPMGNMISRVAISPDSRRVAVTTERGTLRVWNSNEGTPATPELRLGEALHEFAYSHDGRWIVTGPPSHVVQLLDADTGEPAMPGFQDAARSSGPCSRRTTPH